MVLEIHENFPTVSLSEEKTVNCGKVGEYQFHTEIKASWHRCLKKGVDRYDGISHLILDSVEFNKLLCERKDLIKTAKSIMSNLYDFVRGSGFILMLSDEKGYLIDVFGDFKTMERATRVNLLPGYRWGEKESGTNGIGTALALREPIQVSGGEHYCKKLHTWTCSAAPIFNENTRVIGSLQMSGPANKAHPHTLGLVVAAVKAIGAKISVEKRNLELSVMNNRLKNVLQSMSEAAMIIDKNGTVRQINSGIRHLFGTDITDSSVRDIWGSDSNFSKILSEGKISKNIEVLMDTARGQVSSKITVVPLKNGTEQQTDTVVVITPSKSTRKSNHHYKNIKTGFNFNDIIGNHNEIKTAIRMAQKASFNTSHVLIEGESGTGKELFAQAIHNHGPWRNGPFLAINCASLPRDLIVSELFGYAEGAFTGALRRGKPGKFEMASGGTLFLDEIGDMPIDQQATLLRVLQEKRITRLGGDKPITVDTRIICATNRNLQVEVQKGRFRQDLFYRLNVILITLPPLRNRGNDLLLLFDSFLNKVSARLGTTVRDVQPAVKKHLIRHDWPGNLRELENVVEKLITATDDGIIRIEHLPKEIRTCDMHYQANSALNSNRSGCSGKNIKLFLAEKEHQLMIDLLQQHKGNISRIAREMGVSRNTIYRKMESYGIAKGYHFK